VFLIDIENEIVVIRSETGQVQHGDVVRTLTFLLENRTSYKNKKLMIIDPSSDYSPSQEELQEFMGLITSLLENLFSRIALVVPRDLHYGLGRMTEVGSEDAPGEFRVFRTQDEARDWLAP
jgi:hypothetical protein